MTIAAIKEKLHEYINSANEAKVVELYSFVGEESDFPNNHWDDEAFVAEMERRVEDYKNELLKEFLGKRLNEKPRKLQDKYSVVFHDEANNEYKKAISWYEEEFEGLGKHFSVEIENKIDIILKSPKLYAQTKKGFREAVVETFPYVVVYMILDDADEIFISSIFHTSRNPRKKYRKD